MRRDGIEERGEIWGRHVSDLRGVYPGGLGLTVLVNETPMGSE